LSKRFCAVIVDLLILIFPAYIVMTIVWDIIFILSEKNFPEIYEEMTKAISTPGYISSALTEIYIIQMISVFFLIVMYFTISETRMNGQTIGKIIFNIKVVCEDGEYNYKRAFLRNFLRILDIPFGFILIAKSKKKQRPGDIFTKTIVVEDK
ncbi:MAG: RDD family protein, partial [Candidatus Altarchaeaceae archaeon]